MTSQGAPDLRGTYAGVSGGGVGLCHSPPPPPPEFDDAASRTSDLTPSPQSTPPLPHHDHHAALSPPRTFSFAPAAVPPSAGPERTAPHTAAVVS